MRSKEFFCSLEIIGFFPMLFCVVLACSCRYNTPHSVSDAIWLVTLYEGVKGTLPLHCLPLWGREGVTLIITEKYNRIAG